MLLEDSLVSRKTLGLGGHILHNEAWLCLSLDKLLNLSESQFPRLSNGMSHGAHPKGLPCRCRVTRHMQHRPHGGAAVTCFGDSSEGWWRPCKPKPLDPVRLTVLHLSAPLN